MSAALRARLADGRWHFQHGPIDLVIGAWGEAQACAQSCEDAWIRFEPLLDELVAELPLLRRDCRGTPLPQGPVARRMALACGLYGHALDLFVTPMAAVAGAVADEIIGSFRRPGVLRAYVNNGGDIAIHLTPGQTIKVGLVTRVDGPAIDGRVKLRSDWPVRGVATSGWRGRSLSLGIADSVTVLARDAAAADAAATMIANAIDVDDVRIARLPADSVGDQGDLGQRLVTVEVPPLPRDLVTQALDRGEQFARKCLDAGWIDQAMLSLQGEHRLVADQLSQVGQRAAAHQLDDLVAGKQRGHPPLPKELS